MYFNLNPEKNQVLFQFSNIIYEVSLIEFCLLNTLDRNVASNSIIDFFTQQVQVGKLFSTKPRKYVIKSEDPETL